MMQDLINAQVGYAQQALDGKGANRHGTITAYDPSTYSIKAKLQPDNVETGWLPLKSQWVGNGWGMFTAPSIGDAVEISYQEGNEGVGSAGLCFYNDEDRPLPVPSGECWLVHQSGSFLKFLNDGSVQINAESGATYTAPTHRFIGEVDIQGAVKTSSTIVAGGDVTGNGISLYSHTHTGVKSGDSSTGQPQ